MIYLQINDISKALGKLGGDTWVKMGETFDIKRPIV
jgi:hypothetical protein